MRNVVLRTLGAVVVSIAWLGWPTAAEAQQQPDVVNLVNGGRVRGHVMEDDAVGVTVLLADGTTKKIPRGEVMRVDYASSARAAPASPRVAPPPPPPALLPAAPPTPAGGAAQPSPGLAPPTDAGATAAPPISAGVFDRLRGTPVYAYFDTTFGVGHMIGSGNVGGTNVSTDFTVAAMTFDIAVLFPVSDVAAVGAGGVFEPTFGMNLFEPAGFFGAYLGLFPIPESPVGFTAGFGLGGGGVQIGPGGFGPALQLGASYEFLDRHGQHPFLAARFNYIGDIAGDGNPNAHQLSWTFGAGVSYR